MDYPWLPIMSNQHYLIHAFEAVRSIQEMVVYRGLAVEKGVQVSRLCAGKSPCKVLSEMKADTYLFSRMAFAYCAEFWSHMEFGSFLLFLLYLP